MRPEDIHSLQKINNLRDDWNNYRYQCQQYLLDIDTILNKSIYGQEDAKNTIFFLQ